MYQAKNNKGCFYIMREKDQRVIGVKRVELGMLIELYFKFSELMYSSRLEQQSSRLDRGTFQNVQNKDHSSRPQGSKSRLDQNDLKSDRPFEPTRRQPSRLDQKSKSVHRKASRLLSQGADPKYQPSRLEDVRADSNNAHRQITTSFFSLFSKQKSQTAIFQVTTVTKLKIKFKRTSSSIGKKKKKEKEKRRKEKKKEGSFFNLNPNPIKNPRRAKENLNQISSPHPYQKASWRFQKKISRSKEAQLQRSSSKHFKLQHQTKRVCPLVAIYLIFSCIGSW